MYDVPAVSPSQLLTGMVPESWPLFLPNFKFSEGVKEKLLSLFKNNMEVIFGQHRRTHSALWRMISLPVSHFTCCCFYLLTSSKWFCSKDQFKNTHRSWMKGLGSTLFPRNTALIQNELGCFCQRSHFPNRCDTQTVLTLNLFSACSFLYWCLQRAENLFSLKCLAAHEQMSKWPKLNVNYTVADVRVIVCL